jgi:hypothetical protein
MPGIQFDAEIGAVDIPGGEQRRAGPAERIEHQVAGLAECRNEGFKASIGFCVGCSLLPV